MNDMLFDGVTWLLTANDAGHVGGLRPTSQYGDICKATFKNNKFLCDSKDEDIVSGQLIDSKYSIGEPLNNINVRFEGCVYDPRFGSAAFPQTNIAYADERGKWFFKRIDFAGIADIRAVRRFAQPAAHPGVDVQIT